MENESLRWLRQALDTFVAEGKGIERLAAIGWIKGFFERPARPQLRQQLQGIEQIALPGGVRSEKNHKLRETNLNVFK